MPSTVKISVAVSTIEHITASAVYTNRGAPFGMRESSGVSSPPSSSALSRGGGTGSESMSRSKSSHFLMLLAAVPLFFAVSGCVFAFFIACAALLILEFFLHLTHSVYRHVK